MTFASETLQAIKFQERDSACSLEILDQLLLPHKSVYEEIKNIQDGWDAIRSMKVRVFLAFLTYQRSEEHQRSQ
jgi:methylthioribose-1-phosphate isomerase